MHDERRIHKVDRWFLIYLGILVIFGLIILTSASAPVGYEKFKDTYFFIKRQVWYGLLPGIIAFLFLARIKYDNWRKLSWVIYGVSLLLLALVFVPGVGMVINGSRSWLGLGPSTFQPSEFAKLAIVIMAASLLSEKTRLIHDWKNGLLPVLAILAPAFLLILLQPDVGTLSILVVIIFIMLYMARAPKIYLIILGLLGIIAFAGLMFAAPYRVARLTVFLHPELDPRGVGYHINQAFLAIGSGGFWGLGLGNSRQKFQYLPEASADSVFAVMAEETGFLISAAFVILVLLLCWRGLKIAKEAPDEFGRLLAGGVVVWIAWQSCLNVGAMVGILPLTGVPLPFVSHGGSAMMMAFAAMGLVAGVSRGK